MGASYQGEMGDYIGPVVSCLPLKHYGIVVIYEWNNIMTCPLASEKFVSEK